MTDNPAAEILQQHLSGVDVSDQLAGLLANDPQLSPVAQLLANRDQNTQAETAGENAIDASVQAQADLQELDAQLQRQAGDIELLVREQEALHQSVRYTANEVERLHALLDPVAAALGACPTCLGEDADCPLCRGQGVPGSLPPDPECFRAIVWPAVRAHAYQRSRTVRGRPDTRDRSVQ